MVLTSIFGFSQNGGQANENNILKITYQGWLSGEHKVLLQNKLNCTVTARYDFDGIVKDTVIPALTTITLSKAAAVTSVLDAKAKRIAGAACVSTPDNGWVEIKTILSSLPIKFKSINGRKINANTIYLVFEAEEDNTINYYRILLSKDGKTFKQHTVVFPNGVEGNKIYTVTIKL